MNNKVALFKWQGSFLILKKLYTYPNKIANSVELTGYVPKESQNPCAPATIPFLSLTTNGATIP